MALTAVTTLKKASIMYPSGAVNATFELCLTDGNADYATITFEAVVPPGQDPKAAVESINKSIQALGYAPVPAINYAPVTKDDAAVIAALVPMAANPPDAVATFSKGSLDG